MMPYRGNGYFQLGKTKRTQTRTPSRFGKHRKKLFTKQGFLLVFFLCLASGGVYGVFFSPLFVFQNIEISGLRLNNQDELLASLHDQQNSSRFLIFPQKNLLVFSSKKARENIMSHFIADDVTMNKHFFKKTLAVEIQEPVSALTWITQGRYFYLNHEGKVVEEINVPNIQIQNAAPPAAVPENQDASSAVSAAAPAPEMIRDESNLNTALPKITDESSEAIEIGGFALEQPSAEFIIALFSKMLAVSSLKPTEARIVNKNYTEIKVSTDQGFYILFETRHPLERQLENLSLIYKEKISKGVKPQEYIDLRDDNNTVYIK